MEIFLSLDYDEYDILKRNIDLFNNQLNESNKNIVENEKQEKEEVEYIKILDTKFLEKIHLNIFLSYDKFESLEDFKKSIVKNINIENIEIIRESIN